jgi:hypothetical protein
MGVATSCSSEDSPVEPVVDPSQPITFITNISDDSNAVSTRAYNGTWEADDKVGIFMLDVNDKLSRAHHKANKQYKIEQDNSAWKLTPVEALYYPVDGSSVHFTAYYPYNSSLKATTTGDDPNKVPGTYAVTLGDQNNTKAFDLLYHKGSTSYSKASPSVISSMQFEHQLSKVIINVKRSDNIKTADLSALEIIIKDIPTSATFDLATGTLSNWGAGGTADVKGNVTTYALATPTTSYDRTHEAIIVPHSSANETGYSGRTITFTFKDPDDTATDVTVTYKIPDTNTTANPATTYKAFSPEKKTIYNFTLDRNKITVENVTVVDWIQDGDAIDENIY